MTEHPLIGCYLVWDSPDRSYWTLGRFKTQLAEKLFLVEPRRPADDGPALGGDYVVHLGQLVEEDDRASPAAQIFEDFAAVQSYVAEFEKPVAEKVVKLVKK